MSLALALTAAGLLAAAFLAFTGLWLFAKNDARALGAVGHPTESLIRVFAGRYLAMAAMLAALTLLAEWRALAVVLAIGGLMGFLDLRLVRRAGGPALPHAVAGALCLLLAAAAWRTAAG